VLHQRAHERAAGAGDHNAFRDLVQGHSHELQVHCYRILGSLQDAEDALQETLVSAWRNLGEFGQRSSLRTWLYQIATNRCLSMLRADSRRGSSGTGSRRPTRQPGTAAEHRLVARFTDALERADLDALIELLVTDVRLSMPPAMLEYRGIESAQRVLAAVSFRPGRTYRVVPTRANGQPAFGLYLADPHASVYRAYCLLVITTAGDHITAITSFSTSVMTRFGLPRTLPETD
jgi:RNA polymerase sigma factor (sigma-70 family)